MTNDHPDSARPVAPRNASASTDEDRRRAAIASYAILDTSPEPEYDDLTFLAAHACGAPIAYLSFFDGDRVWMKSRTGTNVREIPRRESLCGLLLETGAVTEIPDLTADPGAAGRAFTRILSDARFYAGAPIANPDGIVIGTLSVLDRTSRTLSRDARKALEALARLVMTRLELRRTLAAMEEALRADARTQERLAESEQRLMTVINTVGEGITFSDERGHFEVYNPRMQEITGYTMAEANAAADFSRLLYPEAEDHQRALDGLKELLAKGAVGEVETNIRTKEGEQKTLLVSTAVVRFRDRTMFLSTYRDISARKRAEQAMLESEKKFRAIFDNTPAPTWLFDYDTLRFLEVNEAMVRHYGYAREELQQMQITQIRPSDHIPRLTNLLHEIRFRPSHSTETVHQAKDGRVFEVSVSWNTIWIQGRRAVLVVAEDISDVKRRTEELRRATDAAEEASRAKTEFLANMSHEIRTPMNGVIGMTSLLLESQLSREQREYVETIRNSGVALLTIINDILNLAKFESGQVTLERHRVVLEDTVEDAFDLFSSEAETNRVELMYWIDPTVPPVVETDGLRLRQVLVNLVSNAIKFTHGGHVWVTMTAGRFREQGLEVNVEVRDTGIGIPADHVDRLFKPFSQVDASATRRFGGTGLGLAIAARLVDLLGGTIGVESVPERGSMFRFSFVAPPVKDATDRGEAEAAKLLTEKQVLLCAQDLIVVEHLQRILQRWDARCAAAGNATDAVTTAGEVQPDIVIGTADLLLAPGQGVLEQIRKRAGKRVPAILLANPSLREPLESRLPEDSRLLLKPVRQVLLRRLLIGILREPSPAVAETGAAGLTKALTPMRILVAEDNPINQKLLLRVLKGIGYEADLAANGLEVLDALRRQRYDLVFMDVQMPEMDGLETSRIIAREFTGPSRPKIIAMTAHALDGDKERCLDAGMHDYLTKPVLMEEVRHAVARWADVIRAEQQAPAGSSGSPSTSGDPLLDRLHLLEEETDRAFVHELVQVYLAESPPMLDAVERAFQEGNFAALNDRAHALKGSSLNLGAVDLGAICRSLEEYGRGGQATATPPDIARLRPEFERVCQRLTEYVGAPA